ncbi:MAG TPA: hypothetical protein VNF68_03655 [Candidatus Baltobacteraceae bacterium]|nr:hypothetical protein [Candidatus Baltobacteraceae bacterium]
MSTDKIGDLAKGIKKTILDARDTVSEALHKSTATAERAHRDDAGDTMTSTEKLASAANEAKERIAAATDNAKRTIRDKT